MRADLPSLFDVNELRRRWQFSSQGRATRAIRQLPDCQSLA
jgi:hypothetical protein